MRKKGIIILSFLFILNFFAYKEVYRISQANFLEVHFFDVGQGDATYIKTSSGHRILIDGGPNSLILGKLSKNIPPYDKTIDLIILTHPHSDHLRGLISVLENYKVKNIIYNGVLEDASDFRKWEEIIKKRDNNFVVRAGIRIHSGKTKIDILYPFDFLEKKIYKEGNDTSLVVKVNYKESSFLFTGDASKIVEREIVNFEKDCNSNLNSSILCDLIKVDSDVLQLGHHGSKTSTDKEFLIKVSPYFGVISAGKENKHGHPHKETLDALNNNNIDILRTDELGDIKILSNGKKLELLK